MADRLHCLNCGHNWYPRYKKSPGLRKCPNCGKQGNYEALGTFRQKVEYYGTGLPAGTERVGGCGLQLFILVSFILLLILRNI